MEKIYSENPLTYAKPYPGILELVSALRGKKVKTAVLTNKRDSVAQKVISGLFPIGSFDYVQGETHGKPRKPDPSCVWELLVGLDLVPANTIFIGDSEVDIETAVAAGCFPMGVSWGYRSREILKKAGARHIIDTPCELLDFFL
jgi:phosphoglycolate phosphatase